MKKLMIMAAFMVAAVTANAQGEVGTLTIQPKIGMNLASVANGKEWYDVKTKTLVVWLAESRQSMSLPTSSVLLLVLSIQNKDVLTTCLMIMITFLWIT